MNYLLERRQEEKERRRGEILDAAEAIAASEGFEAMTMDQVARKARLSRALLYVYFQDKSDLLFAIGNRALDILRSSFIAAVASESRGIEQVAACGRAYLAFAREYPIHFDALARFTAHASQPEATACNESACLVAGDRVHAVLIGAIENGIRDGSIRASAKAAAMMGAVRSCSRRLRCRPPMRPMALRLAAMIMALVTREGLRARWQGRRDGRRGGSEKGPNRHCSSFHHPKAAKTRAWNSITLQFTSSSSAREEFVAEHTGDQDRRPEIPAGARTN